ncbi:MAG TPA: NAD(P)-dependent oxidoreductase [Candidatus Sulfotelmatobacter sp.]|nr:NAD(P)-dependent oxidoreductase [Candidatus Sulfotelmatobacter sp.]
MKPTVGFIGLGLMGTPIAGNLLKAGFPVVIWNRTREKAEEFARKLAKFDVKVGANPRETAEKADILITIVSDPPALEAVLWGQNGAMGGLRRDTTYIDSSTVSPALARKIAEACTERGVGFLDAPVTGGTWGAEKGELVFMVGGGKTVLERVKPALEAMGKHIFLLGPNGAGQTVKLAMNLILALQVDALAEALALVASAGVPGERLIEVLQSSMARAAVLDVKAPLMLKNEFPPSFPLRLMHKDMALALDLAKQHAISLPAAAAAYSTYDAVKKSSTDDPDYAAVARFWKKS